VTPIGRYATTVRRKVLDFAAKMIKTKREIICLNTNSNFKSGTKNVGRSNLTYTSSQESHKFDTLFRDMGITPIQAKIFQRAFLRWQYWQKPSLLSFLLNTIHMSSIIRWWSRVVIAYILRNEECFSWDLQDVNHWQ